jgi:hypothetical protein
VKQSYTASRAYEEICRNPEIDPQTAYGIALRKLRNMKKENYGK